MVRGGVTDPKLAERDEARQIVQELQDSLYQTLDRMETIRTRREELNDVKIESRGDAPAYEQVQKDDEKLRDELDQLGMIAEGLREQLREQRMIAYPPEIGAPPWDGSGKKKTRKNIIGPLKKGELTSLGYSSSKKAKTRRQALKKAVDRYGPLSTLRKVNAIRVLTKRRSPKTSKTYKSDVNYLQKMYF